MANFTTSPNMLLPIPSIGIDPGPDYAANVNLSLNTIEGHNHSVNSGVQITPTGLNINSDLTLNGNNLTNVNTIRFNSLSGPLVNIAPNIGALYISLNELYYNDFSGGHQVQLTNNGNVAGAVGSIGGLAGTGASVNFGSSIFVFQSATNTAATLDIGSLIMRPLTVAGNGFSITLSVPTNLSNIYDLVLPIPPAVTSLLQIDTAGNITASVVQPTSLSPSGVIQAYGGVSAPTGWLICNGAAVSRTTYAALFGVIGVAFGVGDGSTTFNIPNLVDSAPFGIGNRFTMAQAGGFVDPSFNTMVTHAHSIADPGHHHSVNVFTNNSSASIEVQGTTVGTALSVVANGTNTATTGIVINNSGLSTTYGNMPPFLGVNYIIKT